MAFDAAERSLRARIAGLARSAKEPSGTAISAPARKAFLDKFYAETDPALPEKERQRQAAAARKAHMARLSHQAALKRRRATEAINEANEASEAEARAHAADTL